MFGNVIVVCEYRTKNVICYCKRNQISLSSGNENVIITIIIIIIFINCNWVDTRWQWLFYMHTEYEIGY